MAQVIVNPEEVLRFARQFQTSNEQLKELVRRLRAQLGSLGETWKDQEYQRFAQEFEQAARASDQFSRAADQYVPYLQRKAESAQRYLDQR